jgi:hypothetical protein
MLLHTQAEHGPVGLTGPFVIAVSCQGTRSYELVGGKGFEPNRPRKGERGYGPSADHPHVPPVSLHRYAVSLHRHVSWRQNLPVTWRDAFSRQAQKQKGLLGDRPRRPGSR